MKITNIEILNAIKDLSTEIDDNYNEFRKFILEVKTIFVNLIHKNNLVE